MQVGKAKIGVEWRSETRKGKKIFVDVVEAEIVRTDITLAMDKMVCFCLLFVVCFAPASHREFTAVPAMK